MLILAIEVSPFTDMTVVSHRRLWFTTCSLTGIHYYQLPHMTKAKKTEIRHTYIIRYKVNLTATWVQETVRNTILQHRSSRLTFLMELISWLIQYVSNQFGKTGSIQSNAGLTGRRWFDMLTSFAPSGSRLTRTF